MKKYFAVLLIVFVILSTFIVQAEASKEQPLFLLGQNEKAEVIISGKATSLELGKNPIQLITSSQGRKLILCAGEATKSGDIKQGGSLRLMSPDSKAYAKIVQCDSSLTAYTLNKDLTTIWLATRGGDIDKETVKPKLYRISLDSLDMMELVLDSIPCDVNLSGDGKWLAVAELGGEKTSNSILTLYDAASMALAGRFEIPKNPGVMLFSEDSNALVIAGYGYKFQENFKIPTEYWMKLDQPVPAGVTVIDLLSLQDKKIDLGTVNHEFIIGDNARVYSIIKEATKGNVRAIGSKGLLWEQKCDFVPKFIQERPESEEVWIIGGKEVLIVDGQTGNLVKDITAPNETAPFLFLENSAYAYGYNMSKRKLNIMKLDTLSLDKTLNAGSAGLAVMKTIAVVASFVSNYNSMQPQYVNGVRMPTNVQPIYWVHSPKGNIVACPEKNKLYMLNSVLAQILTYDLQTGEVDKKLGRIGETTMYLQMSPNRKYLILVSGDNWKLINVENDKAVLTFNPVGSSMRLVFQEPKAPVPYFSPDGNLMYIPDGSKIMVIDLQKAKKLKAIKSDTKDAIVCW